MSCKTLKLNSCEILGSTFSGRTFNFPDRNISEDEFTAKVKGFAVTNANEVINGVVAGKSVFFSKDSLSSFKSGRYVIEYWADFKDVANEMIALEEFLISTTPCACTDDSLVDNFILEFPTETIQYSVKSEITNIYLDFEDLTPEQILELQKPALEVIEQTEIALAKSILATESSIEATSSSVLATEKSVIATENAVLATLGLEALRENVENATVNANANAQLAVDASNLANEKAILADESSILANQNAVLADTASINANTATTNANNATNEAVTATQNAILATEKAENAKGWTPIFIDVSDGVRVVRKLDKYIGGTGTAPTENIGKYLKSDGTYTDVIAQAIDYKGPVYSSLITEYICDNKMYKPTNIDYVNGIFTIPNHTLNGGEVLYTVPETTTLTALDKIPNVWIISGGANVVKLDNNRIQFTKSGVLQTNLNATITIDMFRFEKLFNATIFNNLGGLKKIKVVIKGFVSASSWIFFGGNFIQNNESNGLGVNLDRILFAPASANVSFASFEIDITSSKNIKTAFKKGSIITQSTLSIFDGNAPTVWFNDNQIDSFQLRSSQIYNGTIIQIFR